MEAKTVVADVADELARRIASGEYPPGDLMPSVRQVADEFTINRATAQLVLGRLESFGLVEAQRAKGFRIRDVRIEGGVDVYRRLFRLSMASGELAVDLFHDIVLAERSIVMDALLAYTEQAGEFDHSELRAAIDELETLARAAEPDQPAMLAVELAIVRSLLGALGQTMQRALLNSIGEMILDVPEAVESHFAVAADLHVLVWRSLAAVWDSGTAPSDAQLALFDDMFAMYHDRVVMRFDELVGPAEEPAVGHVASA
ncbi:GntR family transcriptional regulator [Antrihabitans sp. YC2-6]|uniref:GntR family transcriptional regulator n=1 Tax=Antrihabitans sp. YC2-6 TaxID=2799498 RepID=UPI0018F31380|nr:GntR family transcriptional regulator [Antrihabitans sp. YC2-6]MBJ8346708.1 GntR family transcriptional regulator [Antrihabitans sp. YC2-6]